MSESTVSDIETGRDAKIESTPPSTADNRALRWGSALLALAGVGFVANGIAMLYRVFYVASFEAGVATLDGVTRAELAATNHELVHYIDHLHVNVAGLLIAGGIAMVALAWFGVRRGQRWALATAIAMPVVFLAHSLPIHQAADFSFDALLHLGPGAVWLPALLLGGVLAYRGL